MKHCIKNDPTIGNAITHFALVKITLNCVRIRNVCFGIGPVPAVKSTIGYFDWKKRCVATSNVHAYIDRGYTTEGHWLYLNKVTQMATGLMRAALVRAPWFANKGRR